MKKIITTILLVVAIIGVFVFNKNIHDKVETSNLTGNNKTIKETKIYNYIDKEGTTLETRVKTPKNFKRVPCQKDSIGEFLRQYELKKDNSPVLLYNGNKKSNQNDHVAVFNMKLGNRDLQQCADSVIRVYAEYYYKHKMYDKIKFHFVDGFLCDYSKWRQGYRLAKNGESFSWTKTNQFSDSEETFENYLNMVFAYASTLSLEKESKEADLEDIEIGDIFITGGSPGHVVIVVDVCEDKNGEKAFLLAQGYMPAQEFHLLKSNRGDNNPWYYVSDIKYPFKTPGYTFKKECFRKLNY